MGIVSITLNQLDQRDPLVDELAKKYPNVFLGRFGKLKGRQVMLHINKEIKPVRRRNRHASFHLRDGIEKEQFDIKWRSKHVEFRVGEKVLVANEIGVFGKSKSKFKPEVYTVVAEKGSMVTA